MRTSSFFEWADLLDLLEKKNPKAFDFFYHFHSTNNLKEDDLYPSQRLNEIGNFSNSNYQQLVHDFTAAALPSLTEGMLEQMDLEITKEGMSFIF